MRGASLWVSQLRGGTDDVVWCPYRDEGSACNSNPLEWGQFLIDGEDPVKAVSLAASQAPRSLLRDFGVLGSGTFVATALQMARSIAVARILGPSSFGVWNSLQLILSFVPYGTLGILSAMNREVPIALGAGRDSDADRVRSATLGAVIAAACLIGPAMLIAGFAGVPILAGANGWLMALAAVLILFSSYGATVFYSSDDFPRAASQLVSQRSVDAAASIGLAFQWQFPGQFLGFILGHVAAVVYGIRFGHLVRRPSFGLLAWGSLLRIGFPILMVSLTMLLYASADRLAILTFLGTEQLGFYSVAYLASSTISLVPATISQLHYPKLALLFGNSARVADLGTFVEQPAFAAVLLTTWVGMVGYWLSAGLIEFLMPAYLPGLASARIVLVSCAFTSMGATSANLLTTIGRQKLYLALAIPACSLALVATFGAASSGGGIAAVALASGCVSWLFAAALVVVAGRFWLPSFRRRLAFVLRLHLCAAPILVTAALVWTGDHYGWPVALKAVVAVLVLGLFGLGIVREMRGRRFGAMRA